MSESRNKGMKKKKNNNCNIPSRHSTPFNRSVHLLLKYVAIYLESNESERRKRSLFNGHYVCSNLKPSFHVASPNSYRHSESNTVKFQEIVRNSRKFFLESFHVPSTGIDKYISQGMKCITDRAKYLYLVESNVSFDVDLFSSYFVVKYLCQKCTVHKIVHELSEF